MAGTLNSNIEILTPVEFSVGATKNTRPRLNEIFYINCSQIKLLTMCF